MLKLSKNHEIYEVWSEYTCESVFVDHKPSAEELKEICKKNWPDVHHNDAVVEKLKPFYITAPKPVRKFRLKKDECKICLGTGIKSDDSYSTFPCPTCGGTGIYIPFDATLD